MAFVVLAFVIVVVVVIVIVIVIVIEAAVGETGFVVIVQPPAIFAICLAPADSGNPCRNDEVGAERLRIVAKRLVYHDPEGVEQISPGQRPGSSAYGIEP